jgi:hypothetical protein
MLAFASMTSASGAVPISLVCHPQTPSAAIEAIDVSVEVAAGDSLSLAFVLQSDLSRLRILAPRSPGRADGLWRHTCFEAFVMAESGPGYREFNFSPSRQWAVYAFGDYREGGAPVSAATPKLVVRRTRNRLQLEAQLDRDCLPPGRALRLGLSAVVEDADGGLSYWALQHPPGKPDFHHADAFAMPVALP